MEDGERVEICMCSFRDTVLNDTAPTNEPVVYEFDKPPKEYVNFNFFTFDNDGNQVLDNNKWMRFKGMITDAYSSESSVINVFNKFDPYIAISFFILFVNNKLLFIFFN